MRVLPFDTCDSREEVTRLNSVLSILFMVRACGVPGRWRVYTCAASPRRDSFETEMPGYTFLNASVSRRFR